jgi:hypothetical protein
MRLIDHLHFVAENERPPSRANLGTGQDRHLVTPGAVPAWGQFEPPRVRESSMPHPQRQSKQGPIYQRRRVCRRDLIQQLRCERAHRPRPNHTYAGAKERECKTQAQQKRLHSARSRSQHHPDPISIVRGTRTHQDVNADDREEQRGMSEAADEEGV